MNNVREVLRLARTALQVSSPSAEIDAECLLLHVVQKNRLWLRLHEDLCLSAQELQCFDALLARRQQGEPVAYLIGSRGFWSLDLQVNHHTLIPRPETELLVECALEKISRDASACVLDLGTGSGAIALAVKKERSSCVVTAVDASQEALAVALVNANALKLQVEFLHSDWFSALPGRRFDVVLANPPYIAANDVHLVRGDVRFEPLSALVSAGEGLHDIERIAAAAPAYLHGGGWLLCEHGYDQGSAVRQIFARNRFVNIETRRDLSGHERVTLGQHHVAR